MWFSRRISDDEMRCNHVSQIGVFAGLQHFEQQGYRGLSGLGRLA